MRATIRPEGTTLHPAWTYTLRDAVGSLWGAVVFALVMVGPGYWVARWTDLCGFRARGFREQLAWSVVLSLGVGTLPLVAVVWAVGVSGAGWGLAVVGVGAVIALVRSGPRVDLSCREKLVYALVGAAWVALAIGSLIDVGWAGRLWMSVTSYDHSVRTTFVDAVMRGGVVPKNPLYWPGHDAAMRYYYFWYVDCGVVARLAHISARQALVASCVWPPVAVAAMLALFGRYLLEWRGAALRRLWWVSLALMSVTGLDLMVILLAHWAGEPFPGDVEWWSVAQVTSWLDTFLWVPHHGAALVCCLLTALLLWMAVREPAASKRRMMAGIAGLSYASAFGLSTYVAVGAAIALAAWVAWRLFHEDGRRALGAAALAALVAGISLGPYVVQLLRGEPGEGPTQSPLALGVREMFVPAMLFGFPGIDWLHAHHAYAATEVSALLLLVPGYIAELGFFGLVLVAAQRRRDRTPGESTLLFWAWAGLASATFVRSQVIATNDYSVRASLFAQFCLLLLAAPVWQRGSARLRRALVALAVVGVAGTLYQVTMLRFYLPWHEAHHDPAVYDLAERNDALRDAYAAFAQAAPSAARIQYDVHAGSYYSYAQMLQANHQVVNADIGCNTSFGGAKSACPAIQESVEALFPERGNGARSVGVSAAEAQQLCAGLGAQYLVATRWDGVWQNRGDWVWTLPAVVERPAVRIVACSGQ